MSSPGTHPESSLPQRARRDFLPFLQRHLILLILIYLAVVISQQITVGEFHFNGDEMRHAMSGAFFRDALVDHPLQHPLRYVRQYYAKYPALGIPHWPPLFYLVEGVFFLVFGLSVWVSRLCILCYALGGAYFWYRIADRQGPRHLALLSTLIYPLLPYMLLYERATMLEVPMLALSFGAIHFWLNYVEKERPVDIWLVAFFATAACLTSQKAMFLPAFLGIHFLILRPFHLLKKWQLWAALAAAAAAVLPWYLLSFGTLSLSYERVVGQSLQHISNRWWGEMTFYPGKLQEQLRMGWVIPAVAGFFWALLRNPRKYWFFLTWIGTCYIIFTLTQEKDVRHTMIWIPVFIYFGLQLMEELFAHAHAPRWTWVAYLVLFGYTLVKGIENDRPRLWGLEAAARYMSAQPESDIIYYQGKLNGDFIFYTRKFDPEKRRMVAREKQAVATKIMEGYGKRIIMNTPDEILAFFRTWGIRYALVENQSEIEDMGPVTAVLNSDAFVIVRSFPLEHNNPLMRDRRVTLYRYRGALERTKEPVIIPMMTIRKDIVARLDDLVGHPWPAR